MFTRFRNLILFDKCTPFPTLNVNKKGNVRIKNNIAARSRNCRRCATVRNITYSECVPVALVTQQATRMRHIILSSVACPPHTILFHITS
jgi:hypothetical protein